MSPDQVGRPADDGSAIGPLLSRLRLERGWSQLRVAEHLCAAAGVPTVTRHEVSRWERGERVPGEFWLGWLALVLDAPVGQLSAAAAATRPGGAGPAAPTGHPDAGGLGRLAHAWLTEPAGPPGGSRADVHRFAGALAAIAGRLAPGAMPGTAYPGLSRLRCLDDLIGGPDLATLAAGWLAVAADRTAAAGGRPADRLTALAELAQFAGWVAGDVGDLSTALRAYRLALRAATAGGDRPLAGYTIGCAGKLLVDAGDPRAGLLLARTAYAGARRTSSATGRAVLLHRVARAAAATGQRAVAERTLRAAETAAASAERGRDPGWLYWADEARLRAMSGRCLAAVGRPLRAEPLLRDGVRAAAGPREAALAGAALAGTYLELGEVEQACDRAGTAVLEAVRSGSVRASSRVGALTERLAGSRQLPAVREYQRLAAAARPYLSVARTGTRWATSERARAGRR